MSQYMWGVTREKLSKKEQARRDRVACEVGGPGCGFVYGEFPGEGCKGWFFGPNRGEPFDRDLAASVNKALGLDDD